MWKEFHTSGLVLEGSWETGMEGWVFGKAHASATAVRQTDPQLARTGSSSIYLVPYQIGLGAWADYTIPVGTATESMTLSFYRRGSGEGNVQVKLGSGAFSDVLTWSNVSSGPYYRPVGVVIENPSKLQVTFRVNVTGGMINSFSLDDWKVTSKPRTLISPSFVDSAYTNTGTLTVPAHDPGDLLVLVEGRDSRTPPPAPSGWDLVISPIADGTNLSRRRSITVSALMDMDGSVSSVPLTSAYNASVMVFRNGGGVGTPAKRDTTSNTLASTATFPAVDNVSASSLVMGAIYDSALTNSPSGTTRVGGNMAWVTNSPIGATSYTQKTATVSPTVVDISATIEIVGSIS